MHWLLLPSSISITRFVESGIYEKWLQTFQMHSLKITKVDQKMTDKNSSAKDESELDNIGLAGLKACFLILIYGFVIAIGIGLFEVLVLKKAATAFRFRGFVAKLCLFCRVIREAFNEIFLTEATSEAPPDVQDTNRLENEIVY